VESPVRHRHLHRQRDFEGRQPVVLRRYSNLYTGLSRWRRYARLAGAALLVFAVMVGIFAGPARAAIEDTSAKQTVSLTQYESELDRIATAFSDLPAHPGGVDALRQSLPGGWIVDTRSQKYEVSTVWMVSALTEKGKSPSDLKEIWLDAAARLKNMKAEAESAGGASAEINRADAQTRLKQILSQREFNQAAESKSWWSQMWDQVERWIDWLLQHTVGRLFGQGTVKTLLIYAIIGLVFVFAAVWLVRGMRSLVRNETLRVNAIFPPGKHWRDWTREAAAAASRGDYRAAVHSAYWAGVYRLAELGAWQLDRARTPREYLQMMGEQARTQSAELSAAERAVALKELTHEMEASWYGFVPATEQDFDKAVTHLEALGCRFHSTAQTAKF
jgi:hypothetical protein